MVDEKDFHIIESGKSIEASTAFFQTVFGRDPTLMTRPLIAAASAPQDWPGLSFFSLRMRFRRSV